MVHRKFIKRGDKVYGPYFYESYREDGRVKKRYVSPPGFFGAFFSDNRRVISSVFLILLVCSILLGLYAFSEKQNLTSRVVSEIQPVYRPGELLAGTVRFNIREGELIPQTSKVVLYNSGQEKELFLSDVSIKTELLNGEFYAEGATLSGRGDGFGVLGERSMYPEVTFDLLITTVSDEVIESDVSDKADSGKSEEITGSTGTSEETTSASESTPENLETSVEIPAPATDTPAAENGNEANSDAPGKADKEKEAKVDEEKGAKAGEETGKDSTNEKSSGNSESAGSSSSSATESSSSDTSASTGSTSEGSSSSPSSSSSDSSSSSSSSDSSSSSSSSSSSDSSSSSSSSSDSGVTGNVVIESAYTITKNVKKGEETTYALEPGQNAELIAGSVKVNGQALDDSVVKVKVKGEEVIVTTEYEVVEQGFGPDFLGDYKLSLKLDLAAFDLNVTSESIRIELLSEDTLIAVGEKTLRFDESVSENQTQNETLEVEVLNVTSNETLNQTLLNETLMNETLVNVSEANVTLAVLQDIPQIRIPANGSVQVNLSEYFIGAESYSFIGSNVSAVFTDALLNLTADSGFKGASKGQVIAYANESNVSSNMFSILVSSGAVNVVTTRQKIRVGEPVKWVKNVTLETPENLTIELPAEAENITVLKVEEEEEKLVQSITGNVVIDIRVKKESVLTRWIKQVFSGITGNVAFEGETEEMPEPIAVVLNESATEYVIEYYTEAPQAVEQEVSGGKQIIISGPDTVEYTDVIASSEVNRSWNITSPEVVKLYWYNYEFNTTIVDIKAVAEVANETIIVEASTLENVTENNNEAIIDSGITGDVIGIEGIDYVKQDMPFDAYDLDFDTYIDYIEWVVPHLSNQTFDLTFSQANASIDATGNVTFEGNGTSQFAHLTIDTIVNTFNTGYGITGYWNFDKANTTQMYDMSGNNLDSTIAAGTRAVSNVSNIGCIYGGCPYFDGASDNYAVPDSNLLDIGVNNNWTIALWMKPADLSQTNKYLLSKLNNAGTDNTYAVLWEYVNNQIEFYVAGQTGTNLRTGSGMTLSSADWYHVTYSYRPGNWSGYLNGVQQFSLNANTNLSATTGVLDIADFNNNAGQDFAGWLDEVMILNVSLNSSQIQSIYNNQSQRYKNPGIVEE
ncbi:hypothetical protein HYZ97_01055 [Candidatus Pacearchaeota archaeon]|nr:hypothetical protein [Candidatus Pacearchaeota archaeon]